jgi:hypothetical protein
VLKENNIMAPDKTKNTAMSSPKKALKRKPVKDPIFRA